MNSYIWGKKNVTDIIERRRENYFGSTHEKWEKSNFNYFNCNKKIINNLIHRCAMYQNTNSTPNRCSSNYSRNEKDLGIIFLKWYECALCYFEWSSQWKLKKWKLINRRPTSCIFRDASESNYLWLTSSKLDSSSIWVQDFK